VAETKMAGTAERNQIARFKLNPSVLVKRNDVMDFKLLLPAAGSTSGMCLQELSPDCWPMAGAWASQPLESGGN
jgi:hypothetical protein